MFLPKDPLLNCQGFPDEAFRLRIVPLGGVEPCQGPQGNGDFRVIRPKGCEIDCEGLPKKRFSLCKLPLCGVENPKVPQRARRVRVLGFPVHWSERRQGPSTMPTRASSVHWYSSTPLLSEEAASGSQTSCRGLDRPTGFVLQDDRVQEISAIDTAPSFAVLLTSLVQEFHEPVRNHQP